MLLGSLVFLLLTITAYCQNFVVEQNYYGVEEGLAHREVYCAEEDSQGFLWFGTRLGLQRFDGSSFKYYTKETHGLSRNAIEFIFKDKSGLFWLISSDTYNSKEVEAIDIFDPFTEKIVPLSSIFPEKISEIINSTISFDFNKDGEIVFFTENSEVIRYRDTFEYFTINMEEGIDFNDIHMTSNGDYWLIYHLPTEDYKAGSLEMLCVDSIGIEKFRHEILESQYVYIYDETKDGTIRFLKKNNQHLSSFHIIDPKGQILDDSEMDNAFNQHPISKTPISETIQIKLRKDFIWMAPSSGNMLLFDRSGFEPIDFHSKNPEGIYISDIFFDSNDNAWLCTLFGLYKVKVYQNKFNRFLTNEYDHSFPVRGLTTDEQNNLWVVRESWRNLWKIDALTSEVELLFPHSNNPLDDIFGNSLVTLELSKSGDLVFSPSNSIVTLNSKTKDFQVHSIYDSKRKLPFVWSTYEDYRGRIWFANDEGDIGYVDGQKSIIVDTLITEKLKIFTYQFHKRKNGDLWLVSDSGIFVLDPEKEQIKGRYWSGGEGEYRLKFDDIYHISEEEDESIWIGSRDQGLIHWFPNKTEKNTIQFTRSNGLSNNTIYAVYKGDFEHLWMSSDFGIMRFNKKSHQSQTYLIGNGISHNEFNRASHHQGKDGTIYFGGLNGVTSFHPKDFDEGKEQSESPLVITDFTQWDKDGNEIYDSKTELFQNSKITLQPKDQFFRLEFELLTYQDVDENVYAYIIEGVDQEWTFQKENSIRLNRLPYGNHTLKIKGQASDGTWSNKELSINLNVRKPFYIKAWFILLCVSAILSLMFWIYRLRLSQVNTRATLLEREVEARTKKIREDKLIIEKQAETLKSLDKIKSNLFANVSHELRTPLTLISGPVSTLLQNNKRSEKDQKLLLFIERNAKQLRKMVNEILDLSKIENNRLKLKKDNVEFYPFIQKNIEPFQILEDSPEIILKFESNHNKNLFLQLDKSRFEKILNNLISNAIKFTPKTGKITIGIEEKENDIRISVADNGTGIHDEDIPYIFDRYYQSNNPDVKTEGGTGIGLALAKELIVLMGGEISVESTLGRGSRFNVRFPREEAVQIPIFNNIESEKLTEQMLIGELNSIQIENWDENDQGKNYRLLIVEDNPDLRDFYKIILDKYNVLTAKNGKEAISLLQNDPLPNLILSDLMMPVMDGMELLTELKSSDEWRHIPFIMITAKYDGKIKIHALRHGIDDYINKPFDQIELQVRVKNLLNNQESTLSYSKNDNEGFEDNVITVPKLTKTDFKWLKEFEDFVHSNIRNDRLSNTWLAKEFVMSESTLFRRLKKLTGLSPNKYILEVRLNKAKEIIENEEFKTISEVSYYVGYKDYSSFSRSFKNRFGISPSKLQAKE